MKKHCSCCCCCLFKNNNNTNKILINNSSTSLKNDTTNRMNLRRQFIIFMTCFMNLGLTWLTGFFLIIPIENEYIRTGISLLFCLFNSMQGFFLFTIYILVSKSRRKHLKYSTQNNKLQRMKHFLSPTTTTTTTTTITTKTNDSSANISHVYYNQSNNTEIYSVDDYSKL